MNKQSTFSENTGVKFLTLIELPTDVLFEIFKHCDLKTLGLLSQVCKKFFEILKQDCVWLKYSKSVLVTSQAATIVKQRSWFQLSAKQRCRISWNWRRGSYKERVFFSQRTRYMPWLVLERDILWLSRGNAITGFERTSDGLNARRNLVALRGHSDDVCRFVKRNDVIVSGGRDGRICCWAALDRHFLCTPVMAHALDVTAVDLYDNVLVSGSKDRTVKIWNLCEEDVRLRHTAYVDDRVWSLKLDPCCKTLSCGSAGLHQISPLRIYDIETGCEVNQLGNNFRNGAGVLDMLWETPHTLLSCGYDTYIRLWDTRAGECCASWEDPHDSVVYCLASDRCNAILSGTSRHGRIQLWDKRQTRGVQMYYTKSAQSSPVYSVAFDTCCLFSALDRSVNVLDFSDFTSANTLGY